MTISVSPMGPGFFIFFERYRTTVVPQRYGGAPPLPPKDYKKDNDEIIALTLLLARQL